MGKKTKVGKQRKDVFYNLAKETGYRSRAAFKLIQLNRKFQFLEKTRVCVDLCAAPGGWLQVAQQNMPVSSFIIGIDLDTIKPINNCQTFRCDITTEECKNLLKKELKTWKVDTFLHDGAPNVGKSWDHDAFVQNCLTLSALKLASQFLIKGGYFVTKIFRSKDYNALIWVLNKLFKKVHATKPRASRSESAEIFVVCENYLAPDHIDPKFFQSNYLFKEILTEEEIKKVKKEFLKPVYAQKKIKAIGYENNSGVLINKLNASDFINAKNHVELLSKANEIHFDNDIYLKDSLTTETIKEYCKDIKVLSRKEILDLIKWQKKMKKKYGIEEVNELEKLEEEVEEINENEIETDESKMDKFLKKRKKKVLKEKKKLIERLNLKMVHKDDNLVDEDTSLFSLGLIKNKKNLDDFIENQHVYEDEVENYLENIQEDDEKYIDKLDEIVARKMKENKVKFINKNNNLNLKEFDTSTESSDQDSSDEIKLKNKNIDKNSNNSNKILALNKKVSIIENKIKNLKEKNLKNLNEKQDEEEFDLNQSDLDLCFEEEDQDDETDKNDLIVDFNENSKLSKKSLFFEQGLLKNVNFDNDIEIDLGESKDSIKNSTKNVKKESKKETKLEYNSDSESDSDEEEAKVKKKKKIKLDANGLALGSLMMKSNKVKRDIFNEGWNRYTRGDEDLPSWFKTDEDKHFRKSVNVPENLVKEFNAKLGDINVRSCKKVAEAKARKKRKALKLMEKLRKKSEAITENSNMTEKEKLSNIKRIYKKSLKSQEKKKPTLVVAKKGRNNLRRPRGVKGKYKIVDARLKKDKRAQEKRIRLGNKNKPNKRLSKKPRSANNQS